MHTPFCPRPTLLVALCVFSMGCSPVRQVRPLAPGERSISLGLGGSLTEIGSVTIPLPQLSLGYNHGFLGGGPFGHLDGTAAVYFLSMAYGVGHIELGANWRPLLPDRLKPGVTISPRLFATTDFTPGGVRVYPDLGLTLSTRVTPQLYPYAGLESFFVLSRTRPDNNPTPSHWIPSLYAGAEVGGERLRVTFEGRLTAFHLPNEMGRAVQNVGAGEKGHFGLYLGVSRTLRGRS